MRIEGLPDIKILQGDLSLLIEKVELLRRSAMYEDEEHMAVEFIGDEVGHHGPWSVPLYHVNTHL